MADQKMVTRGILWMLVFCLASVLADGIVRHVTLTGFSSHQMLFLRSLIATIILLPFVIRDRTIYIDKATFRLYLWRGFFGFLGIGSWFFLLKYADFTAMIAIGFTSPLFVTVFAMFFLKEKRSNVKIAALLIGFSGAMLVVDPFSVHFNIYLLFASFSACAWAVSMIFTKKLAANQKPLTVVFFLSLTLIPLSFLLALPVWKNPALAEWFFVLLFALIATLSQIALSKAFAYADLMTLMPFEYSQLIFAGIFSYIVFGDIVTTNTILGGLVIIASGYILIRSERRKRRLAQELTLMP